MALMTKAKGVFGKIYITQYHGQTSAIKKVPQHLLTQRQLSREIEIYNRTRHRNVVKLLGTPWLETDGRWCFPLEFITGEDLEVVMFSSQTRITLNKDIKVTIINGMCDGLSYMHSKNICHQDLKPDNIMVEYSTYRAVIVDMGLAKFSYNGLSSAPNWGNEAYAAPEIRRGGVRDLCSDVWAMGKIIVELIVKQRVRTRISAADVQYYLLSNPYSDPVSKMVDGSDIARITMANIIEELKSAGATWGGRPIARPVYNEVMPVVQPGTFSETKKLLRKLQKAGISLPHNGEIERCLYEERNGFPVCVHVHIKMRDGKPVKCDEVKVTFSHSYSTPRLT